jgi:hypothetical protein
MEIRFISFTGPKKEAAELEFGPGLNLIFGPSNTGKSSVLDALDFMLGRERKLKEIPEHEGYDQVLLGIELLDNEKFTFFRNINGGDFQCYAGIHKSKPENQVPIILRAKKSTKKFQTVSEFILEKINLDGKKLKKNSDNGTISLTLRNFLPLFMVSETDIQKEESPYIGVQYTDKTEHKSRLKFVLTGIDDSSLLPAEAEKSKLSRTAKIQILEELITEQETSISKNLSDDQTLEELENQKERIAESIEREQVYLEASQEQYNLLVYDRSKIRNELEQNKDRLAEIAEMISRFNLLKVQYQSDISRLDNITEAGTLISVLPSKQCPLCGNENIEIGNHTQCDGNLSEIVSAATSEKQKIERLYSDLLIAMNQLQKEAHLVSETIPVISDKLSVVNYKLSELSPELSSQRTKYSELLSVRANIDKSLNMFSYLEGLEEKKEELENEAPERISSDNDDISLPTKALFNLSQCIKDLLKEWHFPNSEDVYFDKNTGDFVLNGKHRISNGKGHRAITHAAATLGLMKYAENYKMPQLGFTLIDSPLLAYEEPENEADDLTDTDVNIQFFDYLSAWHSRQTIIFENKKSVPEKYMSGSQVTHFTKSNTGRYGFFPIMRESQI